MRWDNEQHRGRRSVAEPSSGVRAAAAPRAKGSTRHGWAAPALPTLGPRQVPDAQQSVGRGGGQTKSPRSVGPGSPRSPSLAEDGREAPTRCLPGSICHGCEGQGPTEKAEALAPCQRWGRWCGSKAISSAHCMADLVGLAAVLPAGC